MANNIEIQNERWVDQRLTALAPSAQWQPDANRAWTRLQDRTSRRATRKQRWMMAACFAVVAGVCLMAFPAPRVFAHYCLDCSVELWQSFLPALPRSSDVKIAQDRKTPPDFSLQDAAGNPVRLSDFKGKVVLLNFWATWCGGCKVEIPWFIDFESKYKDAGLAVVGISMDDDGWKSVKPYMETKKVNYTVVIGNDDLGKSYGLSSMPMTLLIDRNGKIATTHVGLVSKQIYQKEIETLLHDKKR